MTSETVTVNCTNKYTSEISRKIKSKTEGSVLENWFHIKKFK